MTTATTNNTILMKEEVIWWLNKGHNVPMDIIRYILSEWSYYEPIENNKQFKEYLILWFDESEEKQEKRNNMIFKYGHISDWNTKNISDMSYTFFSRTTFNEDISRWDVSNVTDMRFMYYNCKQFNCDISRWDVSKVIDMRNMFYNCGQFNCDLSHWNIINLSEAFKSALNIFDNCNNLLFQNEIKTEWRRKKPKIIFR